MLKTKCKVQHGPWCGGGSAGNVAGALPCVRSWLLTAMNEKVEWDVVSFNFGSNSLPHIWYPLVQLYCAGSP
jgi:hypothetical protein